MDDGVTSNEQPEWLNLIVDTELRRIDHAVQLVGQAAELTFDLSNFVGHHEGELLRRRDYRLDIDEDGEEEIVALLELGPATDGESLAPHLASVILKKGEKGYRRIPAEWVQGSSMYGAVGVQVRHVTNLQRPDVVVSWAWGATTTRIHILRYQEARYVSAMRENAPATREPYQGPHTKSFIVHPRQTLDFADVDGDGIVEMVQTLSFLPEEMEEVGYPNLLGMADELIDVCRLLKWDTEQERIVQVEERLVVRKTTPIPNHA